MIAPPERRLVLVRHAKSAYPSGVPDKERPLAGRGRRNALACGRWLRSDGPRIQLALVSDAVRAAQTWEIVSGRLTPVPATRKVPGIYRATGPQDLLDLVAATPPRVRTLAVVGHEPVLSATVLWLAGASSDMEALRQVAAKYRTNGVAVLRFAAPGWGDLVPGRGVLETFVVPRA
jgi:phosphohistidine phosphatase